MILDHELQKKVVQKDNVQNLQKCVILSSLSLDPKSANILRSNRSCNLDLSLDIKQNQTSSSKNWKSWEDLENHKNVRVNEKCFFSRLC